MKPALLALFAVLIIYANCNSQSPTTAATDDMDLINTIFDKMEMQGVDTKQNLLYGYFFFDKNKAKLEQLKAELVKQSYKFITLDKTEKGEFMLHVEKLESHTKQSLFEREQKLRLLAQKYKVSSFDGFDVGNPDPSKALVSTESFIKFMDSKKGDELFGLGIKLYDEDINDKAELVFRECLHQNIKPDTVAYKLGNTLIRLNKNEEGIKFLEQATTLNPKYVSAFFNIGATCYEINQYQKSIRYYQEADKLKPNDDKIIYGIAASQYALKQFDKSLENCKKALQLNKDNDNVKQLLQMLESKTR